MQRFSISARLWAPTIGLALVLALAGGGTAVRTVKLIAQAREAQHAQQQKLALAFQWRGLAEAQGARRLAQAAGSGKDALAADIADGSSRLQALQQQLQGHGTDAAENAAIARIAERNSAFDAALAGGDAAAGRAALQGLLAAQSEFAVLQEQSAERMREAAAAERMRTVWSVIGLMALIVTVLGVSTVFLVRTVCHPLLALRRVAEQVGRGDLSVEIDTRRNDEIGDVLHSVAEMRDALRRVVGDVRQSAGSIALASAEVAHGNADLSSRTELTASSLQTTASAMQQLTGTVAQSSDAARQANALAGNAAAVAARGGAVVAQVVSTMDAIAASSRQIADITGVIDGIAFQTNILALNAAVEAARAGEQGRGFAVVASEVRSLAQRSANAAREIKALIGSSVGRVESGSKLVADAGSTMGEIVASVQHVSQIIAEITQASGEQSQGLGQVHGAVTELDRMTQQNAALVEESAAAAESLKHQAARLTQLVDAFRLAPAC